MPDLDDEPAIPRLTDREAHVLDWVSQDLEDSEVAAQLGITVGTTRSHMKNIRRKLGTSTRSGAVALAIRLGIID